MSPPSPLAPGIDVRHERVARSSSCVGNIPVRQRPRFGNKNGESMRQSGGVVTGESVALSLDYARVERAALGEFLSRAQHAG